MKPGETARKKKISSGDIPNSMRCSFYTPQPRRTWWNPGGNVVEPCGTLVEPYLRAAPDPIWAETPKLAAVGEKKQAEPCETAWGPGTVHFSLPSPAPTSRGCSWRSSRPPPSCPAAVVGGPGSPESWRKKLGVAHQKRSDTFIFPPNKGESHCPIFGYGSKFRNWGKTQVLVFGSICQGAILVHAFDPQPSGTRPFCCFDPCVNPW